MQENEKLRQQLVEQSGALREVCESMERELRASELERQLAAEKQRALLILVEYLHALH